MEKKKIDLKKILSSAATKTIILMIACILPLNIFILWYAVKMNEDIQNEITLTTKNVADVYVNSLDNVMENSDYYIFDTANNDPDFITLAKQEDNTDYDNARYRCFWILNETTGLKSEADAFFFYMVEKDDLILAINQDNIEEKQKIEEYLNQENAFNVTVKWNLVEINGKQWLIRVVKNKNLYYGALINLDRINNEILRNISFKSSNVTFTDENMELTNENILVSSRSEKADLFLNISISKIEAQNNISLFGKLSFLMAFAFLTILPILFWFTKKTLIKPIRIINNAHFQLQIGNQDYRIESQANTIEFESSFKSFNEMADNIKTLKIENIEKELAKNKMELNNLQLQIRPHFLLNTFNMIYVLTEQKNNESVKELILYLSDYFRYIYRSSKELELFEKELRLIEGYVKAATIRYPDKININYQIDPQVLEVKVPPLLIHNFIENIINHGLIPDKIINITIFACYEDGIVTFQISDDGKGIEGHILEEINGECFQETVEREHLGIRNSIRRLKYFYGEEACIQFESVVGKGTLVTLTFPYELKEESL